MKTSRWVYKILIAFFLLSRSMDSFASTGESILTAFSPKICRDFRNSDLNWAKTKWSPQGWIREFKQKGGPSVIKFKAGNGTILEFKEEQGSSYTVGNIFCASQVLEMRTLAYEGSNASLYSLSNGSSVFKGARQIEFSKDGKLFIAAGWANEEGFEDTLLKVGYSDGGTHKDLWIGNGKYKYLGHHGDSNRQTSFTNGQVRFYVKKRQPQNRPGVEGEESQATQYFFSDWIEVTCAPHQKIPCKEKKIETIEDSWSPG